MDSYDGSDHDESNSQGGSDKLQAEWLSDAEEEESLDEGTQEIGRALAQYKGKAFVSGTLDLEHDLQVFTEAGKVRFPLTDEGAATLLRASQPAPFGHGYKTVLDPDYREASQIVEYGCNFELSETSIMQQIESQLLPELHESNSRLVAKREKINVYTKGGFFKAHQDTPKSSNMVATLVILLPSQFEGGELVLACPETKSSPSKETTFSWPSKDKMQFVAFYSDRHHEIQKVTSGVRVSIAYSLYKEKQEEGRKATLLTYQPLAEAIAEKLKDAAWESNGCLLGYHCRHKYAYTGADGKYVIEACLKGTDAAFLSAAAYLNLHAEVLPVWLNPHESLRYHHDNDFEELESEIPLDDLKIGQELIVSDQWVIKYGEAGAWYHSEYRNIPRDFYIPEKAGYEYGKIRWCNSYAKVPTNVGSSITTSLGEDTYLGNESATEEVNFYNSAGIFIRIPPASSATRIPA